MEKDDDDYNDDDEKGTYNWIASGIFCAATQTAGLGRAFRFREGGKHFVCNRQAQPNKPTDARPPAVVVSIT